MTKEEIAKTAKFNGRRLLNDLIVFFFGPLAFFFIVKLTGYQIFYRSKIRKRFVILLSSGAAFYLVLIILLFALKD